MITFSQSTPPPRPADSDTHCRVRTSYARQGCVSDLGALVSPMWAASNSKLHSRGQRERSQQGRPLAGLFGRCSAAPCGRATLSRVPCSLRVSLCLSQDA